MCKQLKFIFGYFGQNIFIKIIYRAYLYFDQKYVRIWPK